MYLGMTGVIAVAAARTIESHGRVAVMKVGVHVGIDARYGGVEEIVQHRAKWLGRCQLTVHAVLRPVYVTAIACVRLSAKDGRRMPLGLKVRVEVLMVIMHLKVIGFEYLPEIILRMKCDGEVDIILGELVLAATAVLDHGADVFLLDGVYRAPAIAAKGMYEPAYQKEAMMWLAVSAQHRVLHHRGDEVPRSPH
jgi:hypothetical protein